MKSIVIVAILVLFTIPFTGCVSTSTGGMEVSLRENESAQVRVDDGFFRQHVEIEAARSNRTEFGFLSASVLVRNKLDKDFSFQYKFVWFDGNGMEVLPAGRAWEQTIIHGGELVSLQATAPDSAVVKYTVRLRRIK